MTYTSMLFCSEGKAWMSAGLAAASMGASWGKRLPSFTRWVWNSTDTMVDRYLSGNCKTEANSSWVSGRMQYCILPEIISLKLCYNVKKQTKKNNSLCIHLQHIFVSVIILKDQSDCGNVSCTDHRPQAAQRYTKVFLNKTNENQLK